MIIGAMLNPFSLGGGTPPSGGSQTIAVAQSSDDARENTAAASTTQLAGTELAFNTSLNYYALRFDGLNTPQGATIVTAHLQGTATQANTGTLNIRIVAFDEDDTLTFVAEADNVKNRAVTGTVVNWSPPDWLDAGDKLAAQRVEVTTLVQAIVNRGGWTATNAIGFRLIRTSGTGGRRWAAQDHASLDPVELFVEWTV